MRKSMPVRFAFYGLLLASVLILASSPQDFTLKYAFKNPDGGVFRIVDSYMSGGAPGGTTNPINIYRKDKGVYWSCDPTNKTYVEKKLDETEWSYATIGVFAREEDKQKKTGEAGFLGRPCEVYEAERAGFTTIRCLLQSADLILRSEVKEKEKLVQIVEATEFRQEKPAAPLFEPPAGYKKVAGR